MGLYSSTTTGVTKARNLGTLFNSNSYSISFFFLFCFVKENLCSSEQTRALPGSDIYA